MCETLAVRTIAFSNYYMHLQCCCCSSSLGALSVVFKCNCNDILVNKRGAISPSRSSGAKLVISVSDLEQPVLCGPAPRVGGRSSEDVVVPSDTLISWSYVSYVLLSCFRQCLSLLVSWVRTRGSVFSSLVLSRAPSSKPPCSRQPEPSSISNHSLSSFFLFVFAFSSLFPFPFLFQVVWITIICQS